MRRATRVGIALLATWPAAASGQAVTSPESAGGPTPAQQRYLDGLRTSGRGVAQLKSGIDRVMRSRADSAQLRLAGQRLGGLCGSAGSFLRQGRAKMSHTAYSNSQRAIARRLTTQIDSVIAVLPACQRRGGRAPEQTAAAIVSRLRGYEAALQQFREAVILPAVQQTDTSRTESHRPGS